MKTTLLKSDTVAEGTMTFTLEKPEGFTYKAGQSIDLFLINPPETDAEGNKRAYSLSSAPDDPDLLIATRMRDTAFKRVLKSLPPGTELRLEGPFGEMTLHEDTTRPAVFLAGGIGITPFYSMARNAATHQLPHRITLFYSNRRPEDAAFLTELQDLPTENTNFTFVGTMTDMEHSTKEWKGETGYITTEMLEKYVSLADHSVFYMAGPPSMVAAMRTMLNGVGISNDDIRTEEFTGY
jgi:ferredoxin-NADP reductase